MFLLAVGSLAPIMVLRNIRMLRNPRQLRHYVETSFRYKRLRNQLGVEAAMDMAKRRLIPFVTVMWALLGVLWLVSVLTKF
jgi:hypothetical protein